MQPHVAPARWHEGATGDAGEFEIGHRVSGTKWVVRERLGEGGMGVVWSVAKPPGIRGAMKVLLPHLSGRPSCVDRFLNEVRVLATLQHTNIVRVFDCDVLDNGAPYLVMEALHGGTLRSAMKSHGGAIPADAAYAIIRGVGEGLDRAHAASVVHRDVKPENIFLHCLENDRPRVVLIDFGLAILVEGTRKPGEVVGTPLYMAPEQLRGERETPRTDIYSMALVLYEMLTGRLPWDVAELSPGEIIHAHLCEPPAPASRFAGWIPEAVDRAIASALEKDPAKRPQDVRAFTSKLYELQWCHGSANRAEVHTIAPTVETLAELSRTALRREKDGARDARRGLVTTGQGEPPGISDATLARALALATTVPDGRASVDRFATTGELVAATYRGPTHGTEVLDAPPPPSVEPEEAEVHPVAMDPSAAPVSSVGDALYRSIPGRWRGRQWATVAAIVIVTLAGVSGLAALQVRSLAPPVRETGPMRSPEPHAVAAASFAASSSKEQDTPILPVAGQATPDPAPSSTTDTRDLEMPRSRPPKPAPRAARPASTFPQQVHPGLLVTQSVPSKHAVPDRGRELAKDTPQAAIEWTPCVR
jgi:serine/threonine-protein kinase